MADQQEEAGQLFATTYFATNKHGEFWLTDGGCAHHMTYDEDLFKELDITTISKVIICNGECISVKGKGTIAF